MYRKILNLKRKPGLGRSLMNTFSDERVESNFTTKKFASEAAAFFGWLNPIMLAEIREISTGSVKRANAAYEPGTPLHKYWDVVKTLHPYVCASLEDDFKHMLISQAQTQSNIGDIADRINSVDSSMKKTEKNADIITVERPIVRGLVHSGAIKRLVFRNGIQYDELPC